MKIMIDFVKNGEKMHVKKCWKVVGAYVRPKGITLYAKQPNGVTKVVLSQSS